MSKCPPRHLGSKHKFTLIHFPSLSLSLSLLGQSHRSQSMDVGHRGSVCNSSSSTGRGANHSTAIDHLGRWHMFSLCTLSFSLAFPSLSDDLFPVNCFCCLSFFIIAYPSPLWKNIFSTFLAHLWTVTARLPCTVCCKVTTFTSVQSHTWVANYCCLAKRYTHTIKVKAQALQRIQRSIEETCLLC